MMLATVQAAVRPILYFRPSASTNNSIPTLTWYTQPGGSQTNLHTPISEEVPVDSNMIYIAGIRALCSIKVTGDTPAPGIQRALLRARTATVKANGSVSTFSSTIQFKINGVVYLTKSNDPGGWTTEEVEIPIADLALWDFSDLWVDLKATLGNFTNKAALSWMEMEFQ